MASCAQSETLLSIVTYEHINCFFNNRPIPINRHTTYFKQAIQKRKYRVPSTDWQPFNADIYFTT
jgi:hypothetical protein